MNRNGIVTEGKGREKYQRARTLRREITETENLLWQHLRKGQLDGLHFRRQQVIDGFIVDFYCHTAGLIVEADGEVHISLREKDAERDAVFAARGLHVLHFTNERIQTDIGSVLAEILRTSQQISGASEE